MSITPDITGTYFELQVRMENFIKILQIVGQVGGILALVIAPYLYFENRKLRQLSARKNRKIAQEELEKLERNEESSFEEKMGSLPVAHGRAFEMEGYDTAETQREVNAIVRKRENYFNDASKLKALIEEQEEIENMSTLRGLFGLKPKEDILLASFVPKQTLMTRICERFKKF